MIHNFSDLKNKGEEIIEELGAFLDITIEKEKVVNTIKQDLISISLDSKNTIEDSKIFAKTLFQLQMLHVY